MTGGGALMARRVSVIVPCRNEAAHIETFLEDVRRQQLPDGAVLDVIVADGASEDGTREVLDGAARAQAWLRVVDNPCRIVSTGLNRALAAATGDVIVRMDVHTRYADDYILECLRALETTGADVVGGPWVAEGYDRRTRAIAAALRSPFGMGGGSLRSAAHEGPVDSVSFGCWKRETLERHGGFDETMARTQDAELNRRIRGAGGVIWQTPRIRFRYLPRRSFGALFRQFALYGVWKARLIRRDPRVATGRHFAPPALFLALLLGTALVPLMGWWPLLAVCAAYLLASGGAAVHAARAAGEIALAPITWAAFVICHLAYGPGFLFGLLSGRSAPSPAQATGPGARTDYALTFAAELTGLLAGLLVFRLAAVAWGPDGFGEYVLARRAMTLLQPALLVGMGLAVTRDLARDHGSGDDAASALPAALLLVSLVAAVVLGALNAFPVLAATVLLGAGEAVQLVVPLSVATAGLLLHALAYAALRGRMAAGAVNLLQVTNLAVVPLAAFLWPRPTPARVILVTGALWCLVAGGTVATRLVRSRARWAGRPLGPSVRRLVRYGGPRVPGELGFVLLLALPVLVTAHVAGVAAAGFVGVGLSLARVAGTLAAPLGKVLLPRAAAAAARGERAGLRRTTARLTGLSVGIPALAVIAFIPLAEPILSRFLGTEFVAAVPVVRLTVLAAVPLALYLLLRNLLDALDVRPLNAKNIGAALVVMAAGAALSGSAEAVAAASVAGFAVLGGLTLLDALRLLRPAPLASRP